MLLRYDPFRELDRITEQAWGRASTPAVPMDAYRADGEVRVMFDLPGIEPDSIDLTVEKNTVTVRAERLHPQGDNDEVLVHERPEGLFSRQIMLGEALSLENLEASYKNGVLCLTIPESEQAKPRKVSVGAGQGQSPARPIPATSTEQGQGQ